MTSIFVSMRPKVFILQAPCILCQKQPNNICIQGARHAKDRRIKFCLYLCQQFYLHMGDLARYIETNKKE